MPAERPGGDDLVLRFQHDARNQLNLIIGYVDLLQRTADSLDAEQQSCLKQIHAAAVHLGAMVEALPSLPGTHYDKSDT